MERAYKNLNWILITAFVLAGCETTPIRDGDLPTPIEQAFEKDQDVYAALEKDGSGPPPEVMQALLPPIQIKRSVKATPKEQRFDITVSQAPAREFFMSLVEDTPENVVLHPGVGGNISLALKNVTIREVLEAVKDVYGYPYEVKPYGYQILPNGLQTRIYEVNYLDLARSGVSQTRVSSGQVTGGVSSGGGDSKGVSGTSILTEADTDLWEELSVTLEVIIGDAEGRSVVTNPDANVIIIRAMPNELFRVERFLEIIETNLERQVILEARVLEVILSDGYQQGINWGAYRQQNRQDSIFVTQKGGGSALADDDRLTGNEGDDVDLFPWPQTTVDTDTGALTVIPKPLGIFDGDIDAMGGVFTIAAKLTDFTTLIELLETQGDVETLSSPRVSTVNNQKAVIKVGFDEFFVTGVKTTSSTAGGATTSEPTIELTPFFSGISLDVLPQISEDEYIILHVHPTISAVADQTKTFTINGHTTTLPLAKSTIRETDSVIRTENGQIVVIGGLMENKLENQRAATPWLSRIPLWGALFRQLMTSTVKTELVVLLKATVVAEDTWKNALRRSKAQFERIRRGIDAEADSKNVISGGTPPALQE